MIRDLRYLQGPPDRLHAHPTKAGPGTVVWHFNDRPSEGAVAFIPETRYLKAAQAAREALSLMEHCSWSPTTMSGTSQNALHDRLRRLSADLEKVDDGR